MNIWRIAGTVAALCAFGVIGFAVYSGKLTSLNLHDILELLGIAAFSALFMLGLITFPYYWFKTARIMMLVWKYAFDRKVQLTAIETRNDLLGMLVSCLLIGITLWLGKSFFSIGH